MLNVKSAHAARILRSDYTLNMPEWRTNRLSPGISALERARERIQTNLPTPTQNLQAFAALLNDAIKGNEFLVQLNPRYLAFTLDIKSRTLEALRAGSMPVDYRLACHLINRLDLDASSTLELLGWPCPTPTRPKILLLSGKPCAGKSTLAHLTRAEFPPHTIGILEIDDFCRPRDYIRTEDAHSFNEYHRVGVAQEFLIQSLASGQRIDLPSVHATDDNRNQRAKPQTVGGEKCVIVVGTSALASEKIRSIASDSIFIDLPLELCLARQLARNELYYGHPSELTLKNWRTLRELSNSYIEPLKLSAAEVLRNGPPIQKRGGQPHNDVLGRVVDIVEKLIQSEASPSA